MKTRGTLAAVLALLILFVAAPAFAQFGTGGFLPAYARIGGTGSGTVNVIPRWDSSLQALVDTSPAITSDGTNTTIGSGTVRFPLGTAAAPSLTNASDPTTGTFWGPGGTDWRVSVGGALALQVTNAVFAFSLRHRYSPDNTLDIGEAADFRPRTIYAATGIGTTSGRVPLVAVGTSGINSTGPFLFTTAQWTNTAEPACNATNRGIVVYVAGGAGVLDTFRLCRKDAADAYAYVTLF